MKPAAFAYDDPRGLDDVLGLLARDGEDVKVLAGGQSLVPLLNFRLARPDRLVDLNRVEELAYLRRDDDVLRVGALARHADLERSAEVAAGWPLLAQAVRFVGHAQIRARGTVCGSVAHADPAAELPVALVALDARFHVRSVRGARVLGADELFLGFLTTALEPDEILVEIEVPLPPASSRSAFVEHARTHGDFALGGAAAVVGAEEVRLALLAAGDAPVRAREAEALVGAGAHRPGRGLAPGAPARPGPTRARGGVAVTRRISVELNGRLVESEVEPRLLLSDFIRHVAGLHGTHVGCEQGVCGACTVQLEGEPVRSCLLFAVQADGHSLRTVEGLSPAEGLHPLQAAFQERHALQCGFCTPGFLLTIDAFLRDRPDPTEDEIREALAGNLCRCTGYRGIIEAVELAAERMRHPEGPDPGV